MRCGAGATQPTTGGCGQGKGGSLLWSASDGAWPRGIWCRASKTKRSACSPRTTLPAEGLLPVFVTAGASQGRQGGFSQEGPVLLWQGECPQVGPVCLSMSTECQSSQQRSWKRRGLRWKLWRLQSRSSCDFRLWAEVTWWWEHTWDFSPSDGRISWARVAHSGPSRTGQAGMVGPPLNHDSSFHGLWHQEHQTGTSVNSGQSAQQGGCRTGVPALHTQIFQPKQSEELHLVIDLSHLNRHLVIPISRWKLRPPSGRQFVRENNGPFRSISKTIISMFLCPGLCKGTYISR